MQNSQIGGLRPELLDVLQAWCSYIPAWPQWASAMMFPGWDTLRNHVSRIGF